MEYWVKIKIKHFLTKVVIWVYPLIKTQAKMYKHHEYQLEGELILLKQTLEQKGRKKWKN